MVEQVKKSFSSHHYTETTDFLNEALDTQIYTVPMGTDYLVKRLICVFHNTIIIEPDDVITFRLAGKDPMYFHLLNGEQYLSQLLKNGFQIKLEEPILLVQMISYKFYYTNKFRLFLSGKQMTIK